MSTRNSDEAPFHPWRMVLSIREPKAEPPAPPRKRRKKAIQAPSPEPTTPVAVVNEEPVVSIASEVVVTAVEQPTGVEAMAAIAEPVAEAAPSLPEPANVVAPESPPVVEQVANQPEPPEMRMGAATVDGDTNSNAAAEAPLVEPDIPAPQTGGGAALTEQELRSVDPAQLHQRIDELLSRYAPKKPAKSRRTIVPAEVAAASAAPVESAVVAPEMSAVSSQQLAVSTPGPLENKEQRSDVETSSHEMPAPMVVAEQNAAGVAEPSAVGGLRSADEPPVSPAAELIEPAPIETPPPPVESEPSKVIQEEPASAIAPEIPPPVDPEPATLRTAEKSLSRRRGKKSAQESPEPAKTSDAPAATSGASAPGVDTSVRVIPPMYVVMVTPEMTPVAKVGGLADVVIGLAKELGKTGNTVEVVLPKYDCLRYDQIQDLCPSYNDLWVPWFGGNVHCTVFRGKVQGVNCCFIDAHSKENFFNRGCVYGSNDDLMRFAFFCKAALEYLLKSGKRPDVIHCHDWATGLVPVLLFEQYAAGGMGHCRVCYTIHNFKHQGSVGDAVLHATGLGNPGKYFAFDKMRDNNNGRALNLMKSGIVYSNFITTVSPHYAWDARFGGQGFGMEPTLNSHHPKYGGIINGIDYEYWDPATDIHIPHHYSADAVNDKYKNKKALRERFMLADGDKPIIAFVGRLDPQKGLDMVEHAIFYALSHRAQFVLLGNSPDKGINGHFWNLKRRTNDSPDCHLEIGFNEELAHLIYAGSDMMVVPSRFEPCGLTQLIALRYGSVPVVRAAGGLIDTVFDKDYSDKPLNQRNGYVFNDANNGAVSWALDRAIGCYFLYPEHFRELMINGMKTNYSWTEPAQHYREIYDFIREK